MNNIKKMDSILAFQLLLTIIVATIIVFVRPIIVFFFTTRVGLGLYILLILMPFLASFWNHVLSLLLLGGEFSF